MQTIDNRMTETQIADLSSLTVQSQVKAGESDNRDTTILVYSIQNAYPDLTESQCGFRIADAIVHDLELRLTDMAVQLADAESKYRELAAELSAVDKIHGEAISITDNRYEQCPPEVQNMICSLVVLQVPARQAFLAEVWASARNEGINYAASRLAAIFNNGFVDRSLMEVCDVVRTILDAKEELTNSTLSATGGISSECAEKFPAEFSSQLRKGIAL